MYHIYSGFTDIPKCLYSFLNFMFEFELCFKNCKMFQNTFDLIFGKIKK